MADGGDITRIMRRGEDGDKVQFSSKFWFADITVSSAPKLSFFPVTL